MGDRNYRFSIGQGPECAYFAARALLAFAVLLVLGSVALHAHDSVAANCPSAGDCDSGTTIDLGGGRSVCGLQETVADMVGNSYLGIPFAQAARWEASSMTDPNWTGMYKATAFGDACPQPSATMSKDSSCGSAACVVQQSENCLSLNVWTPPGASPSSNLPVMAYIYGGAFIAGETASSIYDGARLATMNNVVVVSFNYRLGALGFLASADGQVAGNFGFGDQQNALRWIQKYISRFGGDPSQVMLFGESAGAMSVGLHAVSAPSSKGLFRAAGMQSNPLGLPYKDAELAGTFFDNLAAAKTIQCSGSTASKLSCMKLKAASTIVAAEISPEVATTPDGYIDILTWTPIVDGTVITKEPIEAIYEASQNGTPVVPMLLGSNRNEGRIFADAIAAQIRKSTGYPFVGLVYKNALEKLFPSNAKVAQKIEQSAIYGPVGKYDHATENLDHFSRLLTDYLFTCANQFFAKTSPGPVYAYQFNQVPDPAYMLPIWKDASQCKVEVCHGAELSYVFGSFDANWCSQPPIVTSVLSSAMVQTWGTFTNYMNPGSTYSVTWPVYSGDADYMLFATDLRTGSPVATGQPVQVSGSGNVDCSFFNTLVAGNEEWQNYDLFMPPGQDLAAMEIDFE